MTDDSSQGDADAKAALLLIQVLILTLIEARLVDGEAFRRITDEALTADLDLDPAVLTQIVLRLHSVLQDTYAIAPINTSLFEPDDNSRDNDSRT
ncbi:hypothetical protein [Rhodovibrio salinarum]|uniref:Uncharacterized protein n=1 Tax=Rhodovibrio salinarum TaxID=1087 RepID=A0A934V0B8_9PROT|nr:hypothetical protein [Rhodovibrio salinarum]MBK1697259.1 hypothetical protein [Rhodovibrio salinarum]